MTLTSAPQAAAMVLVDNDPHSARLMTRMLVAHGAPDVEHMADPDMAARALALRAATQGEVKLMVIVDLKTSSTATSDFIARLKQVAPSLLVVAMAPSLDRATRQGLLEAGAAAVFERHADLNQYRREAASIVAFWVRGQRLNAVGT